MPHAVIVHTHVLLVPRLLALAAIYFAGKVTGNRALERSGLFIALAVGVGFSLVRIAQQSFPAVADNMPHHEDPAGGG